MDTLEAIHTRRSIRRYENRPVSEELRRKLLAAAMSAPGARNGQPWQFVVIDDHRTLSEIATINPNAQMCQQAPLAILVCGDLALEKSEGYWVVDSCCRSREHALGGPCTGPRCGLDRRLSAPERMDGLRRLLKLPERVIAHSLVVVGYPTEQPPPQDRYRPERVHRGVW